MYCDKKISIILFMCILGTVSYLILSWFFNTEHFNNKRDKQLTLYKSDEILDPDEILSNNNFNIDNILHKLN